MSEKLFHSSNLPTGIRGITDLYDYFLPKNFSSHDVEVEAEATLEELRTFCRNTAINKRSAICRIQGK
jgi:hypothetical protein